jgi:iron complex outermembrane receptor protein
MHLAIRRLVGDSIARTTTSTLLRLAILGLLAIPAAAQEDLSVSGEGKEAVMDVASPEEVADAERRLEEAVRAEEEEDLRGLEEMVVTARKREENLQETPVAITAIGAGQLQDMGARRIDDIGRFVPNLQLDTGAGGAQSARAYIRGIGEGDTLNSFDPAAAIYIDGVYQARATGSLIDVLDIERIEVLRGPPGTLYGRNAIGGAVNFINKSPTDEFEGEARVVAGNHSLVEYYGMLSGPIIKDLLSVRATGVNRDRTAISAIWAPRRTRATTGTRTTPCRSA